MWTHTSPSRREWVYPPDLREFRRPWIGVMIKIYGNFCDHGKILGKNCPL